MPLSASQCPSVPLSALQCLSVPLSASDGDRDRPVLDYQFQPTPKLRRRNATAQPGANGAETPRVVFPHGQTVILCYNGVETPRVLFSRGQRGNIMLDKVHQFMSNVNAL